MDIHHHVDVEANLLAIYPDDKKVPYVIDTMHYRDQLTSNRLLVGYFFSSSAKMTFF